MQSYNQKSVCDFSDEIVSYIYDEIKPREKTAFESHLVKCQNCAEELAAFSEVHLALDNWREISFAPLATPEIIIPYHELIPEKAAIPGRTSSWLDQARAFFGGPTVWQAAAASIIVLSVCTAAVLFGIKFSQSNEIAQTPVIERKSDNIIASADSPAPISETPLPAAAPPVSENSPTVAANVRPNGKVILASEKQPAARQKNPTSRNVIIPVKNVSPVIKGQYSQIVAQNLQPSAKTARLSGEDEESKDDSLRLSELFDETDK